MYLVWTCVKWIPLFFNLMMYSIPELTILLPLPPLTPHIQCRHWQVWGDQSCRLLHKCADQRQYACKYCQKSLMFLLLSAVIQFAASNEFVNSTPERC